MSENPPAKTTRWSRRRDWPHRIMDWFGTEWGGTTSPPGDHKSLRIPYDSNPAEGYKVYSIGEDASTLWIGSMHQWSWSMDRKEARRVAWFIIWTWWIRYEWFGLRRWIWYKALFRACDKTRKVTKQDG